MGMEWIPNKNKHRNLTLEKKILQLFLPRLELTAFQSWVRGSTNWAILISFPNNMAINLNDVKFTIKPFSQKNKMCSTKKPICSHQQQQKF